MTELALKQIAENKKTKAKTLDLGNCGLSEIPEEVLSLVWVKVLILSSEWYDYNTEKKLVLIKSRNEGEPNTLARLPLEMSKMRGLTKLIIRSSKVSDLTPLAALYGLESLYCSYTSVSDLSPLAKLVRMKEVYFVHSQVSDLSPLADLVDLQEIACSETKVSDLSPLSKLVKLETINCASTEVSSLSPLVQLSQLREIYFDSTKVSDLSPLSKLVKLEIIDCGSTEVSSLSPLAQLSQLREIYFGSTKVSDMSPLSKLVKLEIIGCSSTEVSSLSPLAQLSQLKEIYCYTTKISDLSPLSKLVKLEIINCNSTGVSSLSPLAKLNQLREIYCYTTKVFDLSSLSKLVNLEIINCNSTEVYDLSPLAQLSLLKEFYSSNSKIVDLSPIAKLSNLEHLEVSFTNVKDISPIAALQNLKLISCMGTPVADLSPLVGLSKLQSVYFSTSKVTDLSSLQFLLKKGIETRWQNFTEFDAEKPDGWKERPAILIKDCPLTHPPVEIAKQGSEAILRYFEERARLENSAETLPALIKVREAKVLIVGQGKSGKTTLRRKLENLEAEMPAAGDTTRGIEITRLDERMPHTAEALRLNLWDFGGQDIQHYAHQFFLTGSSLYALVTNERIQDSIHLPYWLNIIEMLGKKSPVIIIQNKDGGHCQALKEEAAIRARFGNVHNRVFQSDFSEANKEPEFGVLRKKIIELASELPHIEKEYLRSFQDLRLKLETEAVLERHYLPWPEYLALMPELGEDLMRDYANAFTFLGVCQYFPEDALLSDFIFLRPKWLIDALFELLLHPNLEQTRGVFSEKDTAAIWKAPEYTGMRPLLVRMMKEFELCFRMEGDEEKFIVPQRLPSENKSHGWNPESDIPVQFRYKFMPKGILTRLICRMHRRIENDPKLGQRVWSDAVVFTLPDGKGRVFVREVYAENTIELRAAGEKHTEMLNEIIRNMDDINSDAKYDNLQVEKMMPCPCLECSAAPEPGFHEFEALIKRIDKGKQTSECKKSGEDVPIDEIFGRAGVKKPQPRRNQLSTERGMGRREGDVPVEKPKAKIFISYSKHDEHHKSTLLDHLSGLRDKVVTWHDRDILPGDDWDISIKKALHAADVVLYLVTQHSIATEYIQEVELPIIVERCDAGDCTLVPVIVDFCDWTQLDFAKRNALPEKGVSITDKKWVNENEAWLKVVEGVKRILTTRKS